MNTRKAEIIELHTKIEASLRRSVQDAVRIGHLLSEEKEDLRRKGKDFLPWIESELPFDDRTARRYISVSKYSNKMDRVSNLQEAYQLVARLETGEAQKERERKDRLINEKQRTGQKPAGWDRSVEYEEKKRQSDSEYQERKREAFAGNEEGAPELDLHQEEKPRDRVEELLERWLAEGVQNEDLELADMKTNARQGKIMQVIDGYVAGFPDVSRKLEAVHNLLFYLRRVANKLQTETVAR